MTVTKAFIKAGLRKTHFKKFFLFYFKETGFSSFLRKTQTSVLNWFHCIMQYNHFQNYTVITC